MSTIRIGTNRDYDEVAAFALEVLAEMGQTSTKRRLIAAFEDTMTDPDGLWLVARDGDGAVVGSIGARIRDGWFFDRRLAFIEAMAVRPQDRSSRVAGEMIVLTETWARLSGARHLMFGLPTSSPMKPPTRHGFVLEESLYSKEL